MTRKNKLQVHSVAAEPIVCGDDVLEILGGINIDIVAVKRVLYERPGIDEQQRVWKLLANSPYMMCQFVAGLAIGLADLDDRASDGGISRVGDGFNRCGKC